MAFMMYAVWNGLDLCREALAVVKPWETDSAGIIVKSEHGFF